MNPTVSVLLLSAFFTLGSFTATGQGQEQPRKRFLSVLKEGQGVSLKETAGRFELTVMKDLPLGHKVIEVGADYVVVEDVVGVTETRIPIYSIKSIVNLKVPKK